MLLKREAFSGPTLFEVQRYNNWADNIQSFTLDSGINVPPGITVAPPLENFYITILILFYINLGIAVIFNFFLSSKIFKN